MIYPSVADKVVLWCLHGKHKEIHDEREIIYMSNQDLIEKLKIAKTKENEIEIKQIIENIKLLLIGKIIDKI